MPHKRNSSQSERWRSRLTPHDKVYRMLGYLAGAAVLYALCIGLILNEIALGTLSRPFGYGLIAYAAVGLTVFYLLVRYSHKTGIANWKLAWVQGMYGVVFLLLLYAAIESLHATLLMGIPLVIVFCAFPLRPGQTLWLSACAIAGLALTCALLVAYDPVAFPARLEAMRFLLTSVAIIAVTFIARDLHRLRMRVQQRTEELLSAMARIELLATTDELTSLSNRRHMHELLDIEERRQQQQYRATCIALIDVDHFKQINDRYGHAGGDAALRTLAHAARGMLRAGDTLARWGGEEFLLLMPDTSLRDGFCVMERMLAAVRTMPLMEADPDFRLTFSAGVAESRADERIADAIRRADMALYRAKEQGRDQIVSA
jgi:diguanylate cyclase (GGDEF)-like protein